MNSIIEIRILILEDQRLISAGMKELILVQHPNVKIVETHNFQEAISIIQSMPFDFVFLDIELNGEKNGLDVLDFIVYHEIDVRPIMLSGHSEKETILNCLKRGACGYISKNCHDGSVFQEAIDIVLKGGIFIPLEIAENEIRTSQPNVNQTRITPETFGVSGRTLEVLYYICQGMPNKTIARRMNIEEGTIRKNYVPKLFKIFKVARRTELLIKVSQLGIAFPRF